MALGNSLICNFLPNQIGLLPNRMFGSQNSKKGAIGLGTVTEVFSSTNNSNLYLF